MDAFEVHRRLIEDYRSFTEGFVEIRDKDVLEHVGGESARGVQWPAPWLSLNPAFASGGRVDELVSAGVLHPECERIFRVKSDEGDSGKQSITLHRHQRDAVDIAATGRSYVLTTGTGSGKSLAYIVPIVDRVLRDGTGRGVRAIVVYPMNALANSQQEELRKFLVHGYGGDSPVSFARYTGQEDEARRQEILQARPDILLTNYVMLELLLTRPRERNALISTARDLRFLVLDELHTYRGRQGADVAMLVRRLREACGVGDALQCVGTSATMSTGGTVARQRHEVAKVATTMFGTQVSPDDVITETLQRATATRDVDKAELSTTVLARGDAESADPALQAPYDTLRRDPLASWIEDTFGVEEEADSKRLVRRPPTTVRQAAATIADVTTLPIERCETALRATLLAASRCRDPLTDRPLFAFRLHQFLSKGGTVEVTAEPPATRAITSEYQLVLPGDRRLYPLAFCRECGQEFLMVTSPEPPGATAMFHRRPDMRPKQPRDGYLYISADHGWPLHPVADDRFPVTWLESTTDGKRLIAARRDDAPIRYLLRADGSAVRAGVGDEAPADPIGYTLAAWIPGQFRFCLRCGVSYENLRANEFSKLVALDREGRSSAMSVIAASVVRALRSQPTDELLRAARKLLTFVDNRQDASLQAGHFNDFAQVAQLRGAIHLAARQAVEAGDDGLDPVDLGPAVTRALDLQREEYAEAARSLDPRPADRALRAVVEYRALRDLQRGWRVTLPNLEQTGLLIVDYPMLRPLADGDEYWAGAPTPMRDAAPGQRLEVLQVLLDELRRVLAIDAEALTVEFFDRLRRLSREHLTGLWALSDGEPDPIIGLAVLGPGQKGGPRSVLNLTGRGTYGRWLRHPRRFGHQLSTMDADAVIRDMVERLDEHSVLVKSQERGVSGYRLKSSAMLLRPGDGTGGAPDPVRRHFDGEQKPRVVPFFRDLYLETGRELAGLRAAEHTAQVPAFKREEREELFREGTRLPLLFCSPTMELGVDISTLNAVAMRNVPPTPANYAQRSGRAGRSGQPALVMTYCASGNNHDRYYFDRSRLMVAGQVQPPRIDLANEDLVRSHVHAVWLAESGQELQSSMSDVLALDVRGCPVAPGLADGLRAPGVAQRALRQARELLAGVGMDIRASPWWTPTWLDEVVSEAFESFDRACQRWRQMYATAEGERAAAYVAASDASATRDDRQDADLRYRDARQRIELLLNTGNTMGRGDFYTYRYFASEGFLPGYSFPRLPLAAYIPGTRGRDSTWLQRPRFIAVSEFGPGALVYHEGARYQVTRISLPRGTGDGDAGTEVVRSEVRVCGSCGYHHQRRPALDKCELCDADLGLPWRDLMQMQTVITRPRQRISADEEERNRVGFEMITTYRFSPRGGRPGRQDATATHDDDDIAYLCYGDAAEVRVTNLGRRDRKNKATRGFWLDLVKGRWLSEAQAAEGDADEDLEGTTRDVQWRAIVTPYVEDRRNILLLRWAGEITDEEAVTLRFAVERGIEAVFQLEDSELTSEQLPDAERRGRSLLVEAAEGGAGVLRRLITEPEALARVAAEALRIMHVDPDTGQEADDACVRGCYRCLLSYGNQLVHEQIDRRIALARLRRLATATVGQTPDQALPRRIDVVAAGERIGRRAAELLALVESAAQRQPDEIGLVVAGVRVDLVYRLPAMNVAVLVEQPGTPLPDTTGLTFDGWYVVAVSAGQDLRSVMDDNPGVFRQAM